MLLATILILVIIKYSAHYLECADLRWNTKYNNNNNKPAWLCPGDFYIHWLIQPSHQPNELHLSIILILQIINMILREARSQN